MKLRRLAAYSTAHFAVDFACAFLFFSFVARTLGEKYVVAALTTYNVLAFGTEFVVGNFFDARGARRCACLGILGVFAALCCGFFARFACVGAVEERSFAFFAVLAAGLGNSFFHVGGGIDVLARSLRKTNKYWRGGAFLSTGALGLALGTLFGNDGDVGWGAFAAVATPLFFSGVGVWTLCPSSASGCEGVERPNAAESNVAANAAAIWSFWRVIFATSAIFVRSFVGFFAPAILASRLSTDATFPLALASAAFGGKLIGGFLADRFGGATVGVVATVGAIPALCWSGSASVFWLGVVLLNVSTAITLVSTAESCGGRLGYAFGLTTVALLFGYFAFAFVVPRFGEDDSLSAAATSAILLGVAAIFIGVSTVSGSAASKEGGAR